MGVEAAAAAAIIGAGVQTFGQIKQAKAQKRAARAQARAKAQQAEELLKRSDFNIDRLHREAREFRGLQTTSLAAAGADVGAGSSLLLLEQLNKDLVDEINVQRQEAFFKAQALRAGADVDLRLGGDIKRAGTIGAIGTSVDGVSRGLSLLED